MRRLQYIVDLQLFQKIKKEIVPVLFTEHQFQLIEKRFLNKKMTSSEKNEFSRTVSKKMKAINKIMEKEANNFFIYGEENILPKRLDLAKKYLTKFSRKFKNKPIFISGSFLYNQRYNDIDIFVISKYDKEDYQEGKFHINYLTEDVYSSLFFASLKRLCITNKKVIQTKIEELADLNTFISLYQEVFNDFDRQFKGVKKTLREFLLPAAFLSQEPIPDSAELGKQIDSILGFKKPAEIIKKIFTKTVIINTKPKKAKEAMNKMIQSYQDLIKEYKQHKQYYLDLIQAFQEVISIVS